MAKFYINAGNLPGDGLSASTGYHNMQYLLGGTCISSGDIVEFVDNGIIDDSEDYLIPYAIYLQGGVTYKSYNGDSDLPANVNKPIWKLSPVAINAGLDSVHVESYENPTLTIFSDLNIVGTTVGFYIGSNIFFSSDMSPLTVERCTFNQVSLVVQSTPSLSVVDCVFIAVTGQSYFSCIYNVLEVPQSATINNNVFYGGDSGITIQGVPSNSLSALILNNIFDGQGVNGVSITDSPDVSSLIIDYCNTFGIVTDFGGDSWSNSYLGSHNIRNIDPEFTNPGSNDFTLQTGSPCIASGIGHNIQPSVPTVDFNSESVDLNSPDIGAFKFNAPPPPPPPPPSGVTILGL